MTTDPTLLRRLGDLLLEAGAVVHQMADQAEGPITAEVTFDAWYARRAAHLEHTGQVAQFIQEITANGAGVFCQIFLFNCFQHGQSGRCRRGSGFCTRSSHTCCYERECSNGSIR